MKKVFMFLAASVAVLGLMSCGASNETSTESAATTEENVEAEAQEPAADPLQRDFESADLSLTIPEGWTGEVGVFDEVKMQGKSDDGFDPKIEVCVVKGRKVSELVENEPKDGVVKNEGVKIGEYTFTTLNNENSGSNKCFAQVGDNVLRVTAVFIKPEAPEVAAVIQSVKLK
ncbi:MAG: hypothetical protein II786_06080 [Muribaculaceae bacterium]|nr:hypothetical protein [Muribaculaceae bacterium]MBR3100401.1 hypothetical protein [Muribaculaceae bacterium]